MKPADFTRMELTVEAGVGTITLNRPERRNAWAGRTALEYRWALHWCHVDQNVRAVVLTGDQDFCVGADASLLDSIGENGGGYTVGDVELPEFPEGTPPQLRHNHLYPLTVSTPVIAAIRGGCAGAGFLVATYADIRFADRDAKIASSFASLGLPAEYGSGWLLPRIVGLANAAQLLYTPGAISAERAASLGWVQHVSQPGEVVADAVAYARALASGSSAQSLRTMKRQLFIDSMFDLDQAYRRSVSDMNEALQSIDFKEGVRALRAKEKPNFLSVGVSNGDARVGESSAT
jgi:enoyl-CoA hydratase/carnithine racemase